MTRYNVHPNQLNRLKRVEKLHPLKSQPMFCEAPQTQWCKAFDFLTRISRFPMYEREVPSVTFLC